MPANICRNIRNALNNALTAIQTIHMHSY